MKRAALTGFSESHTRSPRSGLPLGLIPHATPAARKPAGSPASGPRSRTCAGARTQREWKNGCGGPALPSRGPPACESLGLGESEHQVEVLHGLRGGALPEVVDRRQHDHLARVGIGGGEQAAEVGLLHVPGARRLLGDLDERLVCVRFGVEALEALRSRPSLRPSRSSWPARPGRAARGAPGTGPPAACGRDRVQRAAPRSRECAGGWRPCREGCSRPPSTGGWSRRTRVRRPRCPAWRRSPRRRSAPRGQAGRARGRRPSG